MYMYMAQVQSCNLSQLILLSFENSEKRRSTTYKNKQCQHNTCCINKLDTSTQYDIVKSGGHNTSPGLDI